MNHPSIIKKAFDGTLDLSNPNGTIYVSTVQVRGLAISKAVPGGWALVSVAADGSSINVPSEWIHYGGDEISIVNGDVNHIQVFYKDSDTVFYTNKVV